MRQFYRLRRSEFWLAMATLVAVITLDVLPALIIGIVFSVALLIYHASRPQVSVLGSDPAAPGTFEDVGRHPDAIPVPGVLVIRPDAPLFYANDQLDITSAEQLEKLAESLNSLGVEFAIAHMHQPAQDMARATGLLEKVGQNHIFPTIASAVQWAKNPV